MSSSRRDRFSRTIVISLTVTFVVGAFVTPPDPFTQLLAAAVAVPLAVALSYVLVYRGGYEYLGLDGSP